MNADKLAAISLTLLIVLLFVNATVIHSSKASSPDRQVFSVKFDNDGIETKISAALLQELGRLESDDKVLIFVKLSGADTRGVAKEGIVGALKEHKMKTQPLIIGFLTANGARIINTFWINNSILTECSVETVYRVASLEEVESIYPNTRGSVHVNSFGIIKNLYVSASPAENSYTWGLARIRAPDVWENLGITGFGIRVAVLDTGVDITHQDLAGKMWTDNALDQTYPGGWIEFDENGQIVQGSTPHDLWWHGTHVSGTVIGGNVSGTAIGVAPDSWLMHAAVADENGTVTQASVLAGMQWAMDPHDQYGNSAGEPANVVNMSFGIAGQAESFREAIENLKAAGIVPVASAGNQGEGIVTCPGNVYESFTVGATDNADVVWENSGGTTVDWPGSDPETYIKPDFSAPGTHVYSAMPDNTYAENEGTSMAAPHVSGTVALMLQANPNLTVDNVYKILKLSADDLGDPGQDNRYGWGILDAYDAVTYAIWETTTQAQFETCATVNVDTDTSPGDVVLPEDIALWHLDENSGDVILDETVNNNDGTIRAHHGTLGPDYPTNSPTWTDNGKVGGALSFDGDDYVEVSDSPSLSPSSGLSGLSVEAWVNVDNSIIGAHDVICKRSDVWDPDNGWEIYVEPAADSSKFKLVVVLKSTGASYYGVTIDNAAPFDQWAHVAFAYEGSSGTIKVYVNGTDRTSDDTWGQRGDNGNVKSSPENLFIGCRTSSSQFFKGKIDEVRVYDRALTASEIAEHAEHYPLAFWRLNEGSGTTVHDDTANNNDGTIYGAVDWVTGKDGTGLRFENTGSAEYVSIPPSSSLNFVSGNFTVELWVNPNVNYDAGTGDGWRFFARQDNQTNTNEWWWYVWAIGYNGWDDKVEFVLKNTDGTEFKAVPSSTTTLSAGTWYHIVGVKEGDNLKLYINGEFKGSTTFSGTHPSSENVHISWEYKQEGYIETFDGVIDEVRIENRALTSDEISARYEGGEGNRWGLAAEYRFENVDSGTARDDHMWDNGKYGKALRFGGVDDYVEVPDSTSLDVENQITLMAWVYPRVNPGDHKVIVSKYLYGSNSGYLLKLENAGGDNFRVTFVMGDGEASRYVIYDTPFEARWWHLAGTYDGREQKLYVDGELVSSSKWIESIATNDLPVLLGAENEGLRHFDGIVDEVHISNLAKTAGEIAAEARYCTSGFLITERNYHDTGVANPSWGQISWNENLPENTDIVLYVATSDNAQTDDNTVALWHLDENSSLRVFDSTQNGNDGGIYYAEWTDGKFGTALQFDNNAWVKVPASPSLNISGTQITLEAWVYPKGFASGTGWGEYGDWVDQVIAKGADAQDGYYGIQIKGGENNFARFYLHLGENLGTAGDYWVEGTTDLQENTWYHLAGVYNGSTMRIYVNENLEGEENENRALYPTSTADLYLGKQPWDGFEYYFDGIIDEVRISNVARSENEIQDHYQSGNAYYAWDNWTGPYTVSSGENITSASKRYVKWKAVMSSIDGLNTPILHDVTVDWY